MSNKTHAFEVALTAEHAESAEITIVPLCRLCALSGERLPPRNSCYSSLRTRRPDAAQHQQAAQQVLWGHGFAQ